jgi:hypothetical protein
MLVQQLCPATPHLARPPLVLLLLHLLSPSPLLEFGQMSVLLAWLMLCVLGSLLFDLPFRSSAEFLNLNFREKFS